MAYRHFVGIFASIRPRDVLAILRKIENRGAIDTARRVNQTIGQLCSALPWPLA